jgi:hypothetical protein
MLGLFEMQGMLSVWLPPLCCFVKSEVEGAQCLQREQAVVAGARDQQRPGAVGRQDDGIRGDLLEQRSELRKRNGDLRAAGSLSCDYVMPVVDLPRQE